MRRNQDARTTPENPADGATRSADTSGPNRRTSSSVTLRLAALVVAVGSVVAAFDVGAHAGAALNGRVMAISVGQVPMPLAASAVGSAVHTHVR